MTKKIAASILGKKNKKNLINILINKGIDWIHYDVMDGKFVLNNSLPINEIKFLFKTTKPHFKDIHLMVQNPIQYIDSLINFANCFSVHIESVSKKTLKLIIKKYSKKTKLGLVLNPSTDLEKIFPHLENLHHVTIMSVIPGKGGQEFIEKSIEKIKKLKKEIFSKKLKTFIQIDGGINNVWGPIVFKEGANIVVSGSYLIDNINNNSISKILGKN